MVLPKEPREFCVYCGRWYPLRTMTPMTEEGKTYVRYYCERCLPDVQYNILSVPWRHLLTFGEKGQKK